MISKFLSITVLHILSVRSEKQILGQFADLYRGHGYSSINRCLSHDTFVVNFLHLHGVFNIVDRRHLFASVEVWNTLYICCCHLECIKHLNLQSN